MPNNFAQLWPYDLRSDGKIQQTITPAATPQSVSYVIEAPKGATRDKWNKAVNLVGKLNTQVDQPAMGGAVINWDDLFRCIGGLELRSELLGTLLNRDTSAGPYLKHVIEFIGNGYRYAGDGARAQIASADGDTAITLYFTYPFAPRYLARPEDAAPWLGWLHNTEVIFTLAANNCLDAVSTGAVIEATTNVQFWLEYVVSDELNIPVMPYWHLHNYQNAGGTEIQLRNVGGTFGLQGVEAYCRLAAILECMDQKGFGGPDGADNITATSVDQLGLKVVQNTDAFVKAFKSLTDGRGGPVSGVGASTPINDLAGNPEGMGATPTSGLNSATLMYFPIYAPSRNQKLTKLPKWNQGDLQLTHLFTSTPSSGIYKTLVHEIKEFNAAKKVELLQRAGVDPSKAMIVKKTTEKNLARVWRDGAGAGKLRGIPEKVTPGA